MQCNRRLLWILAVVGLCLLGSCASTPGSEQRDRQLARQRAAVDRWNRCTTQNFAAATGSVAHTLRQVEFVCDGHKRDVLATFPPHLEKRLNTLLVNHTRQSVAARLVSGSANTNADRPVSVTLK